MLKSSNTKCRILLLYVSHLRHRLTSTIKIGKTKEFWATCTNVNCVERYDVLLIGMYRQIVYKFSCYIFWEWKNNRRASDPWFRNGQTCSKHFDAASAAIQKWTQRWKSSCSRESAARPKWSHLRLGCGEFVQEWWRRWHACRWSSEMTMEHQLCLPYALAAFMNSKGLHWILTKG